MPSHSAFLTGIARSLVDGEFATILGAFEYPTGIYFEDRVAPCQAPADLLALLKQFHSVLVERGVTDVSVEVVATSASRGALHSAWLEKTYLDVKGWPVDHAQLRFFFATVTGVPRIRMIEYTVLPFRDRLLELPFFRAA